MFSQLPPFLDLAPARDPVSGISLRAALGPLTTTPQPRKEKVVPIKGSIKSLARGCILPFHLSRGGRPLDQSSQRELNTLRTSLSGSLS